MHANAPTLPALQLGLPPEGLRARSHRVRLRREFIGAVCLATASTASAYTALLNPASPQTLYLQIGAGSFTNCYTCNPQGTPGNNSTVNTVSTTVVASAVGNGIAQPMTTDSAVTKSYWDNFTYCTVPGQLYIGGFYRTTSNTNTVAQVVATVPAALTDAAGDRIPFSQIKWASSGIGDAGAEPFPAGTFVNGGTQNVGSMSSNTWNESCWTFTYLNSKVPAAGTYTGVVTYTMSAP